MKLTQAQAQSATAAPKIDLNPLAQRIREMEQRIEALQQAPRTVAIPAAAGSFDQKVLEAVVNALDARLHEHAGQVERRLTELEARLTIELKDLDQQDQALARGTQARLDEMRAAVREEISSLRGQVASMQHDMASALGQVVQEQVEQHVAAQVTAQVASQMQSRMPAIEQAIQQQVATALGAQLHPLEQQLREEIRLAAGRATTLLASAADATVEERLAPVHAGFAALRAEMERNTEHSEAAAEELLYALRSEVAAAHDAARQAALTIDEKIVPLRFELEQKSREIAEVRERVGETDRSVLDMILSIGVMCRQTAERIGPPPAPAAPPPSAPAEAAADAAPPRVLQAGASSAPPDADAAGEPGGSGGSSATGEPCEATPSPKFAQSENPFWKIPLVSSFLLATGGLLLLHYL
jgi:hypothetical protein